MFQSKWLYILQKVAILKLRNANDSTVYVPQSKNNDIKF